jgi:hypothetical protein
MNLDMEKNVNFNTILKLFYLGYSFIALKIHYIWTLICSFNYYLWSIVVCFHPLGIIDVFIKLDLQCFKKKS